MCFGTAVMANLKHLRYAARDPHCGFVHIKDSDPYLRGKGLDYSFTDDETEFIQLTIQSYHELKFISMGARCDVLNEFRELKEEAVRVAEKLFENRELDNLAKTEESFGKVYDYILSLKQ